ncbi:MAG: sugar phosphate isomerase/epimerase, partial [Planctomycetaceae bacterium]|nr:sugar phosphate isomerase/epimerase [Planctomycetaceae bacterium]
MLSRRQFLGSAAAGMAASSLLSASPLLAAEPVIRTGRPYFKLSLAAYSFNRQLNPKSGQPEMTLLDFID